MKIIEYPERKTWKAILRRPSIHNESVEEKVIPILKEVKLSGDTALRRFTLDFDKAEVENFEVNKEEISKSSYLITEELKEAIDVARENIEKFHIEQKEEVKEIETTKGILCWRENVAIEKVGLYIPGGTAPLFSTILMLGIPAKIAGCEEIVLCTPPDQDGNIHPALLYTANILGIKKIYKVGGAQAIAAMAYGTESISRVYKIFGPGNQFVTMAKQLVNIDGVAIDMPAGPSELAVIADITCNPKFVAADLISQTEHGTDSHVIFVSDSKAIIEQVLNEIEVQLNKLDRKILASASLKNSSAFLVRSIDEAIDLVNEYAPEHLILQVKNVKQTAKKVKNAGSVFLGNYTPVAAGDYASGTNHILPTNGYAKAYSGVSLDSFVKKITFQLISEQGIQNLGRTIISMSESEGLTAHKRAIEFRI